MFFIIFLNNLDMEFLEETGIENLQTGICIPRDKAHSEGVYHRVVGLIGETYVGNAKYLLLSRRSRYKKYLELKIDLLSSGHIEFNERIIDNYREFEEELNYNFRDKKVEFKGTFTLSFDYDEYKIREHVYLSKYTFESLFDINFDNNELESIILISQNSLPNLFEGRDIEVFEFNNLFIKSSTISLKDFLPNIDFWRNVLK